MWINNHWYTESEIKSLLEVKDRRVSELEDKHWNERRQIAHYDDEMIDKKAWGEFKANGMLWFVNTILHAFGWAIVLDIDNNGDIVDCFPARVKFRGFDVETNTKGYIALSEYLKQNIDDIAKEAKEG